MDATDLYILQSVQGILPEFGPRRNVTYQKAHRRPPKRVLQYSSQLRITIGYARFAKVEISHDLAKHAQ